MSKYTENDQKIPLCLHTLLKQREKGKSGTEGERKHQNKILSPLSNQMLLCGGKQVK